MMGGWPRSALLLYMSFYISQASTIASVQFPSRDSPSSGSLGNADQDSISLETLSAVVASSNPFETSYDHENGFQATSEIYNGSFFPGRRLKQVDRVFQQKYWFVGCKAGLSNSAAAQLATLVTQIRLNIKLVIREVQKGTASEFGYEAFFKSNSSIPRVLQMFDKIANGDQVKAPTSYGRSSWLKPKKGPPIIGCVSTRYNGLFNDDAFRHCGNPPGYAYYIDGSAWVYLCPRFWNATTYPLEKNCPHFYENGTMGPHGTVLHMNQEAIFVHELVHLYMPALAKRRTERYTVESAMGLSAEEAVDNASNYGYFYSCVFLSASQS